MTFHFSLILVYSILLQIPETQQTGLCTVTLSNQYINQLSTYQIVFTPTSTSASINKIRISFPRSVFPTIPTSVTCSSTSAQGFSSNSPACTIDSASSGTLWYITAPNAIGSKTSYIFTIASVKNSFSTQQIPDYTGVTGLQQIGLCESQTSGAVLIESLELYISGGTFYATEITSVSVSSLPTTNGATAVFTVDIVLQDQLTQNGYVYIQLPRQTQYYVGSGIASSTTSMIPGCTSGSCTTLPTISAIYYATNGGTQIVSFSSITTTYGTGGTTFDLITCQTTVSSAGLAAGGTLTLTITSLKNPPSTRQFTNLIVWTADYQQNKENYQAPVLMSSYTPGAFGGASTVTVTSNPKVYATSAAYRFSLVTANPIPIGSYITIQFTTGIYAIQVPGTLTVSCSSNCNSGSPTLTYDNAGTIKISGIFTTYVSIGATVTFTITGFQNPPDSSLKYYFKIQTYETTSGNNLIDQVTTLFMQPTAGTGTLTVSKFKNKCILPFLNTCWWPRIKKFSISFKSNQAFASTDTLTIILPTAYVKISSQIQCFIKGLSSHYTCFSSSQNTILITSVTDTTIAANTKISFVIYPLYFVDYTPRVKGTIYLLQGTSGGNYNVGSLKLK